MSFRLTEHAELEMDRRKIPRRLLEELMSQPQQVVPGYGGRKVHQSQFDFGHGRVYLLRAIVDDNAQPPTVVTVYRNKQCPEILESDMRVTYDQEVDSLRILLSDEDIEESDEEKPGVIIDYDRQGNVVGLEVLDASTRIANPRALEYAVTG